MLLKALFVCAKSQATASEPLQGESLGLWGFGFGVQAFGVWGLNLHCFSMPFPKGPNDRLVRVWGIVWQNHLGQQRDCKGLLLRIAGVAGFGVVGCRWDTEVSTLWKMLQGCGFQVSGLKTLSLRFAEERVYAGESITRWIRAHRVVAGSGHGSNACLELVIPRRLRWPVHPTQLLFKFRATA